MCIALNTQLVFVFSKRPGDSALKYYICIPIFLSLAICVPALALGLYGYDQNWDMCWYATEGKTTAEVLNRYLFTFGLWSLVSMLYLIIAAATIMSAVFSKSSKVNQLATNVSKLLTTNQETTSGEPKRVSFLPEISETGTLHYNKDGTFPFTPYSLRNGASQRLAAKAAERQQRSTLSRRSLAMRALAFRLLGYILVPTICILPGVIKDLVAKINPDAVNGLPDQVSTMFDTINGLVGLFNAVLYALDPALLALYHQISVERRERRASQGEAQDADMGQYAMYNVNEPQSPSSHPSTPSGAVPDTYRESPTEEVEVRKGKFLSLRIPKRWQKAHHPPRSPKTGGIIIRVDVEIYNDLERLGDFLGGL